MFLYDFIKGLLPKIEKDTVVEDLVATIKDLDNVTIPSLSQASAFFRTYKVKGDETIKLEKAWKDTYKTKLMRQPTFVGDIHIAMGNLRTNADFILKQVELIASRDMVSQAMTAQKAILVRAAEHMSFCTRFASDALNLIYDSESGKVMDKSSHEELAIPKQSRERIVRQMATFGRLMTIYGVDPSLFSKSYVKVPDLLLSVDTVEIVSQTYNEAEIDPFRGTLQAGFIGSPIYHIRMVIADWQTRRFKAAEDKKKALELRLLHLKNQSEGNSSAALEKEIQYTQDRIDKYDRYISEVEEDLGLNSG